MIRMRQRGTVGILAGFAAPEALFQGIDNLNALPHPPVMETFSPYPLEEVEAHLHRPRSRIPLFMFIGGFIGACLGYGMQIYAMTMDYPLNVGGRPLHSWPAFVPVTFELTILCAALSGFFGLIVSSGLPRFHHPVFNEPRFQRASQDQFFLLVHETGAPLDRTQIHSVLKDAGAISVTDLHA